MSAKAILVFCAQALLVQCALSQCTSRAAVDASDFAGPYGLVGPAITPLAYDGLAAPYAYDGFAAPYAYDGFAAPYAYDGFSSPYAYDGYAAPTCGLAGPLAIDGRAPYAFDGYRAPFAYDRFSAPFAYDGLNGWAGRGLAYDGYFPTMDFTPTSGGGLTVTSASAIPPTGLSVISENAYEGILAVAGEVPFVGTTGMEGVLPTAGAGAVNHACGTGINAMVSETTAFVPGYAGAVIESAAFAPGYGAAAIAPAAAITPIATIAPAAAVAPAAAYTGCGRGIVY